MSMDIPSALPETAEDLIRLMEKMFRRPLPRDILAATSEPARFALFEQAAKADVVDLLKERYDL